MKDAFAKGKHAVAKDVTNFSCAKACECFWSACNIASIATSFRSAKVCERCFWHRMQRAGAKTQVLRRELAKEEPGVNQRWVLNVAHVCPFGGSSSSRHYYAHIQPDPERGWCLGGERGGVSMVHYFFFLFLARSSSRRSRRPLN